MSSSRSHSRSSLLSTFNWEDSNIKELLRPVDFVMVADKNDSSQPFCHHTHKNLRSQDAPFLTQNFVLYLEKLTSVKHIRIGNFTNGSQMTVWIAQREGGEFVEVYKDKYMCKGKTLKDELKQIDLGALPCQLIRISVTKGCKVSSKSISLLGVECQEIERALGSEYFKLLVLNPLKIIYQEV